MRTVMVRTNGVKPDPRVEKEADVISGLAGYPLCVLAWDRAPVSPYEEDILALPHCNLPIIRFGVPALWGGGMRKNLLPLLKFETRLIKWLITKRHEYDCVHACDLQTGLPAMLVKKLYKKKIIYDIYDYYSETQSGPDLVLNTLKKLEDYVITKSDATIICSEGRLFQIKDALPRNLTIIHNSPSCDQLSIVKKTADQPAASGKTRVVYVGNLVADRLIIELLEAVSLINDVELHIGGFGVLEEQVQTFSETYSNIFYYGAMDYADVIQLESRCDVMVALYDPKVPNHKYAAPNKFYEALALGKPLIMFHNTGMDKIIDELDIGITCDPTVKSLMEALRALSRRKSEWCGMSERMTTLFNNTYSWDIMTVRLKELYVNISNIKDPK